MSKQLGTSFQRLWLKLKQALFRKNRVVIFGLSVALGLLLLRSAGIMQPLEWAALDSFFRFLPSEARDDRIVIVAIDEPSLEQVGQWPLPDAAIASLLQKLHTYQPSAIGLDLYRDLSVPPGNSELIAAYASIPNLIGIQQLKDRSSSGVLPPPTLSQHNRVGFNNVVVDPDGKVRRGLLYWATP
ncbi:MAG TPA: diguanylate cyclase, partial [Cyanobacteria bacterium UBA11049]|nr:diguanylate cyclase [Cyanobacteria bacterium UBA11049]